jgi:dTMP kinase
MPSMPGAGRRPERAMGQGKFVVLEGVDGSGTTTQCRRLLGALGERGIAADLTREPSTGPVGVLLREILGGKVVIPAADDSDAPAWHTMALLFAADRLHHLAAEVAPKLSAGITVICDRYDHSSLAYQSATGGGSPETIEWIRHINRYARRPDLTFILDVSPAVARQRRSARPSREVYEHDRLQQRLCEIYRDIDRYFVDDTLHHVDADRPFDEVAGEILCRVEAACR